MNVVPVDTSNCSAICAIVRSPLIAAIATLALKDGEWFCLSRLLRSPLILRHNRAGCQADEPPIPPWSQLRR